MENKKEFKKVSELKLWEDNPRSITSENFERLKKHIKKYGQYKPILVNNDNVVLGGNMRVRAMIDLGIEEAWVSVVDAQTRAKMLEYAMSDNETFGDWDEQELAALLSEEWIDLDVHDFKIDVSKKSLEELLNSLGPEENEEEIEEEQEDLVECPNCHHKFKA